MKKIDLGSLAAERGLSLLREIAIKQPCSSNELESDLIPDLKRSTLLDLNQLGVTEFAQEGSRWGYCLTDIGREYLSKIEKEGVFKE